MSLYEATKDELLRMRKSTDGVTVGALARADTIRAVLGGGDPRIAYNTLKHILIDKADDLAIIAASYSLGFASEGETHLNRLTDFGEERGYDQRQARRYSDRGIEEVSRFIATEWTIEASPTFDLLLIARENGHIEVQMRTERMVVIEMREPLVELVYEDERREPLDCEWTTEHNHYTLTERSAAEWDLADDETPTAISVHWHGEVWPKWGITTLCKPGASAALTVHALGAHLQVSRDHSRS